MWSSSAPCSVGAGFSARLHHTGPTVDEWEHRLSVYGTDYMSAESAEIQCRLTADLVVLQQQLDTPRMCAVAARLMTLYAKTFPGSDGNKAVRWYDMAADAADGSEDTDIRARVRSRAAIALGYEGASLPVARCALPSQSRRTIEAAESDTAYRKAVPAHNATSSGFPCSAAAARSGLVRWCTCGYAAGAERL